jgi:hypothetical protein
MLQDSSFTLPEMLQVLASITDDFRGVICDRNMFIVEAGNTKGGSITVPLTSCLTGLESAEWQLTIFLQNRLVQTSQTGGKWYSDTSPFSIPW